MPKKLTPSQQTSAATATAVKLKNAVAYYHRQKRKIKAGIKVKITPEHWSKVIHALRALLNIHH